LRYHLANPKAVLLVAEEQSSKVVAAYILVFLRKKSPARIYSIAVSEVFRGCGLGRLLVNSMRSELKKKGYTKIYLEVRSDNEPAIAMYRGLGFEETVRLPEYYSDRSEGIRFEKTI